MDMDYPAASSMGSVGLLPTKTPRWSSRRLFEEGSGSLANTTKRSSPSISLLGGRLPC